MQSADIWSAVLAVLARALPHGLEGLGGGALVPVVLPDSGVRVGAGL